MIVRQVLGRTISFAAEESIEQDIGQLLGQFPVSRMPVDLAYEVHRVEDDYSLVRDEARLDGISRDNLLISVMQELVAQWVVRDDLALIHGGVVCRDDAALIVAGPSGRGKSTLTAALVRAGFGYASDELAPILPSLEVVPYPLPFRLRDGSIERLGNLGPRLERWDRAAWGWGERLTMVSPTPQAVAAATSVRVGMVVFPQPPGTYAAASRRLSAGRAAFRILAEMLNYAAFSRGGFELAVKLGGSVPCYGIDVGTVDATARLVQELWEAA